MTFIASNEDKTVLNETTCLTQLFSFFARSDSARMGFNLDSDGPPYCGSKNEEDAVCNTCVLFGAVYDVLERAKKKISKIVLQR